MIFFNLNLIIGFIGNIGAGKTLSMVNYINDSNRKVLTNFKIKINNLEVKYLDSVFFDTYSRSDLTLYNTIIAVDECHVFYDSRSAMNKKHKVFTKFITQSRKRNIDFIYTTQDISYESFKESGQVDIRLRKLTDYIVLCKKIGKYIINIWYRYDGKKIKKGFFDGSKLYDLYDTNEIIDISE